MVFKSKMMNSSKLLLSGEDLKTIVHLRNCQRNFKNDSKKRHCWKRELGNVKVFPKMTSYWRVKFKIFLQKVLSVNLTVRFFSSLLLYKHKATWVYLIFSYNRDTASPFSSPICKIMAHLACLKNFWI